MAATADARPAEPLGADNSAKAASSGPPIPLSHQKWMMLKLGVGEHSPLTPSAATKAKPLMRPPTWLNPPWRMLLFGDGSPTKLLHLLTGSSTVVELLRTASLDAGEDDDAPKEISMITEPRVRREVRHSPSALIGG